MTKDDIITLPNPHLRQKSSKIHVVTNDVIKLADEMTAAALDWEDSRPHEISAALAAVQVDKLERVVIVRADFERKSTREYEGEIVEDFEGCLSVKSIYGKVPRYSKIRVKAMNLDGEEVRIKAEGFLARVLQHEIDHCNGLVFIDHIRDKKDAFYTLDKKGELQPLDYDKDIAENSILWD